MNPVFAFSKKEVKEQLRSGKLFLLTALFVLFGIMNPAIALLTPWLLETLSDSLAQSGMTITVETVSALDSWMQFFKNIPMAFIVFVLMQSGILTKEYQSGTLILSITKGLKRSQIFLSKALLLILLWTAEFWLCFAITYGYNSYYWDQSSAQNLMFSAVCWWCFGLFILALVLLFSSLCNSNIGVLLGTGGVSAFLYFLSIFPKIKELLPILLTDGSSLVFGIAKQEDYLIPLILSLGSALICMALSFPIFNKKQL